MIKRNAKSPIDPSKSIQEFTIRSIVIGKNEISVGHCGPEDTHVSFIQQQKDGYYLYVKDAKGLEYLWIFFNNKMTPSPVFY